MAARVARAVGFAVCGFVGLMLAGASTMTGLAVAAVVFFCFVLNVAGQWAGLAAIGAMAWGAFVVAGLLPNAHEAPDSISSSFNHAAAQFREAPPQADATTRLEQLKSACDKGLIKPDECDAARARIVSELAGPKR